jgi:hypothetical protein
MPSMVSRACQWRFQDQTHPSSPDTKDYKNFKVIEYPLKREEAQDVTVHVEVSCGDADGDAKFGADLLASFFSAVV